jgi:hypothetical protein
MCYFEQTQYLACGHNVEVVAEKCELGDRYRTSMHDKIITAIHSNDGQCEKCNPPPAYVESANGVTSDLPDVASSTMPDLPNVPSSHPTSSSTTPGSTSTFSNTPSDSTTPGSTSTFSSTSSDVRYPLVDLTEETSPLDKRSSLDRRDSIGEDLMDIN